jgi:predicted Zn-dependent protease
MERGDVAAAEGHLDRLILDQPANPYWVSQRSFLRARRGNFKGAIEDAQKLVKTYPGLPIGHFALLDARSVEATTAEAAKMVQEVREKLEEDPIVNLSLAYHYHVLDKPAEALALVDRGLEILEGLSNSSEDMMGKLVSFRILLLYEMGRGEDSATALTEAIARYPGNEEIEEMRHELLIAEGRLPEALTAFKKLFRKRPKEELNTWLDRAQAHYMTGSYGLARADFEEVIRRAPAETHAYTGLAAMMILEGNAADAERLLTRQMPTFFRDRMTARQTSNSLLSIRQDQVTVDMLGVSTTNPWFNRALARALQGKRRLALEDATASARGAGPYGPYRPAEALRDALQAGAGIRLNPQPILFEDPPGRTEAPEADDASTTESR